MITYDEGLEKLEKGMKVIIREGSAAKNFDALIDLVPQHFNSMMFCSDDKHPDDLLLGHINTLCKRAVQYGIDVFKILQMACVNPVEHYGLEVGQLRVGDPADLVRVKDLEAFEVLNTIIDGELIYDGTDSLFSKVSFDILNNFNVNPKSPADFRVATEGHEVRTIEALDGELITGDVKGRIVSSGNNAVSNVENDILKIAVVNRYSDEPVSTGFIKNFGLEIGAIASSVAHDSHNIIAVGVSDEDICKAVNLLIENKGGICAISDSESKILPLPVAGIMSDLDAETVGKRYAELDQMAKAMGSELRAPYMTLSFMALLVIPSLKLSDLGLFDGSKFEFVSLESE